MGYKKLNELLDWTKSIIGKIIHIDNLPIKDEDDMNSDSDQHGATQQSIKKFVEDQVVEASEGDMKKSTYDTDNDGIVDKAESVDDGDGNSKSASEISEHINDADIHKKLTLDEYYRCYIIEE